MKLKGSSLIMAKDRTKKTHQMPIITKRIAQHTDIFHIWQWDRAWKAEHFPFQIIPPAHPHVWTHGHIPLLTDIFQEEQNRRLTNRSIDIPGIKIKLIPVIYPIPSGIRMLRPLQLPRQNNVGKHLDNVTQWDGECQPLLAVIANGPLQEALGFSSHRPCEEFQAIKQAQAGVEGVDRLDVVNRNKWSNGVCGQQAMCIASNIPLQENNLHQFTLFAGRNQSQLNVHCL